MRIVRCLAAGIAASITLLAQQPPDTPELLAALARTAALFSRTAPALGARETLLQRGRRGDMQILRRGRKGELKEISFTLPDTFETHEVMSDYTMGTSGSAGGFHEIRKTLLIDNAPPAQYSAVRHAMTLGLGDEDEDVRKKILESLELDRLQGSAADFGPILLLFAETRQRNLSVTPGGRRSLASGTAWVLNYRQAGEGASLMEFRNNRAVRHTPEGQIWFREEDLLPVRITLNAEEVLTPKFTLRNEAQIDYQPTSFGLAPQQVIHRQFLNQDLLVENRFVYSDYRGLEIIP